MRVETQKKRSIQTTARVGARVHEEDAASSHGALRPSDIFRVAILTGGGDKPYALGIASSLISQGVAFDFICSDELDSPELPQSPLLRVLNLRGAMRPDVGIMKKALRILTYYGRLIRYATTTKARVFHILWNTSRLELLDRTLMLLYYRFLGKRIVFTAHNVNVRQRDNNDTWLNRLTLRFQYHLMDHLFVHTERMRQDLQKDFSVPAGKISLIPFGINSTAPNTVLTPAEARLRLGLTEGQKVLLFFGNIAPYKGLEYLVEAIALLVRNAPAYRLIIAGKPKTDSASYWEAIRLRIVSAGLQNNVLQRIEYVPDAETEVYFKAAHAVVLPYTDIFQSGVLFLGYNFGLPVIASDVGSLREDILEGKTGFVCQPRDAADLANKIETYFSSPLYRQLEMCRKDIQAFANDKYSWAKVGEVTQSVYQHLMGQR
jgi:glycosyltransferase involved in cell wall biosynthesis